MAPVRISFLSTPLEVLFALNTLYIIGFYMTEVFMFIYYDIIFDRRTSKSDRLLLLAFFTLDSLRIHCGWTGSEQGHLLLSCSALIMMVPCAIIAYGIILMPIYMEEELLLCFIMLCFYGLESMLALVCVSWLAYCRAKDY